MYANRPVGRGVSYGYRCRKSTRVKPKGGGCETGRIRADLVDAAGDAVMQGILGDPARLADLIAATLDPERGAELGPEKIAEQIARLRAERERVVQGYERRLRTLDEAERRCGEIEAEVRALEAIPQAEDLDVEALALEIAQPFAEWDLLTRSQKQRLLRSTVAAIHFRRAAAGAAVTAVELSGSVSPVYPHS